MNFEDLIGNPLEKISENPFGAALDIMMLSNPEAKLASALCPTALQLVDKLFGSANVSLDQGGDGQIEIAKSLAPKLADLLF